MYNNPIRSSEAGAGVATLCFNGCT